MHPLDWADNAASNGGKNHTYQGIRRIPYVFAHLGVSIAYLREA